MAGSLEEERTIRSRSPAIAQIGAGDDDRAEVGRASN
jgi:hypothetical protein